MRQTPTSLPALAQRTTLGHMVNQSTVLLMFSIGAIILTLALLILFHQNSNATKGYLLRNLERERSQLLLEEEVLKMQVAGAQALKSLEEESQIQTMMPLKDPRYTQGDATVADSGDDS